MHHDSSLVLCKFNAAVGAVSNEDNFGYYEGINPKFRCTQADNSTTQWGFAGAPNEGSKPLNIALLNVL